MFYTTLGMGMWKYMIMDQRIETSSTGVTEYGTLRCTNSGNDTLAVDNGGALKCVGATCWYTNWNS